MYNEIRNLSRGEMQFAWVENISKGDKFKLKDNEFEVVVCTKKTIRLRKNDKENFTFKLIGKQTFSEGKNANLLRDVEGILRLDLLQQYNPFHEVSDIFRLTQSALQRIIS